MNTQRVTVSAHVQLSHRVDESWLRTVQISHIGVAAFQFFTWFWECRFIAGFDFLTASLYEPPVGFCLKVATVLLG